jgi:hypothetical protein
VRELRPPGSVRGASSNGCPYRDLRAVMPASAKGHLQSFAGSSNPTPLEQWPRLVPGPQTGPAPAETLLKQTGPALPPVWPGLMAHRHSGQRSLQHSASVAAAAYA